jgi:hypothetical protein
MRAFEFLKEAMGGMWDRNLEKKSGASIQFEKDNLTYNLIDVAVFPQDQRLSYEQDETVSASDLMKADIDQYLSSNGVSAAPQYFSANKGSAAMVVILGDSKNKLAFIKFYKSKKPVHPPLYWQTSVFQKDTGWKQTGKGKSATAKAAEVKISPYDFVQAGKRYKISSLPSMIEQNLKSRGADYPENLKTGLPILLSDLMKNASPIPVPNLEAYQDQIEVVFGESAAPIALSLNKRVTGSYSDAEKNLLKPLGLTWANFNEVEFGSFGEKIGDSFLWSGNEKIIISSKNQTGGAPASLTGAMETVDKFPEDFGPGTKFYKKYESFLPIFEKLHEGTSVSGVIDSSVLTNIINEQEAEYVRSIYGKGTGSLEEINQYPNLPTVYNAKKFLGQDGSKQGVDLNNPKFQMGYHLLGCLAKLLKGILNKDKTLMTDFFKAILNKSSMVQVYTKTQRTEKGMYFSEFDVVWPPTFTGNIIIESDFYTSNAKPSKKISFVFK